MLVQVIMLQPSYTILDYHLKRFLKSINNYPHMNYILNAIPTELSTFCRREPW